MRRNAKNKLLKITLGIFVSLLSLVVVLLLVLQIGMCVAHAWRPWHPDYAKVDLAPILSAETLSSSDYDLLYRQTGLTKIGVDGLIERGQTDTIYAIQGDFFASYDYYESGFGPFTCAEKLYASDTVHFAALEDGDVIVTPTTHFSFVRFGHSLLVVDGEEGIYLNSFGYGSRSGLTDSPQHFANRPAFLILRPKAEKEVREAIASYAAENLVGIDYSILAGVFGGRFDPSAPPSVTQCAHIVWYAFRQFGIDIDPGGGIVFPQDIANSDAFAVVQVYGMDPDKLWKD